MKYVFDHDMHIHSQLSKCSSDPGQNPESILEYAKRNCLKRICLTDHFWDELVPGANRWYAEQHYGHVIQAKPLPQAPETEFWFGCETDLRRDLTLGISRACMEKFDFIIIPTTHLHMTGYTIEEGATVPMRAEAYVRRLNAVLHMDLPFHKIGIAHLACNLMVPGGQTQNVLGLLGDDVLKRLFDRAAEVGVGIEINQTDADFVNQAPERVEQTLRLFRIAREAGCKFYWGSDSHHPENFNRTVEIFTRAIDMLGLEESDKFHPER